ncbi:hypothetical protein Celaphus_00011247 [Cervus elaphus hippelaphus]|uniref:Uncharacterized protein n=1 Tax=Cervus elaphus hippelaphus TaxID=46360 RepID=A0A212CRK7_CEREH|nr:hypothetical protein Celaphus_00011247 [Cervus elaphus hippelaphus]
MSPSLKEEKHSSGQSVPSQQPGEDSPIPQGQLRSKSWVRPWPLGGTEGGGPPTIGIQPLSLLQSNASNAQDCHSARRAKDLSACAKNVSL